MSQEIRKRQLETSTTPTSKRQKTIPSSNMFLKVAITARAMLNIAVVYVAGHDSIY